MPCLKLAIVSIFLALASLLARSLKFNRRWPGLVLLTNLCLPHVRVACVAQCLRLEMYSPHSIPIFTLAHAGPQTCFSFICARLIAVGARRSARVRCLPCLTLGFPLSARRIAVGGDRPARTHNRCWPGSLFKRIGTDRTRALYAFHRAFACASGACRDSSELLLDRHKPDLIGLCPLPYPFYSMADTTFQMAMAVVLVNRIMRNSSGAHTWPDLERQLRATINLTSELGLHPEQRILERALFRGQRLAQLAEDVDGAHDVLFVFTQKLPNARGLPQGVLRQDMRDLKAIGKAHGRRVGQGTKTSTPRRSRGRPGVPFPPAAPPAGASVSLPLPGGRSAQPKGAAGGKGRKGGNRPPLPPPTARELAAIADHNGKLQHAQDNATAVQGGPTCNNCAAQNRTSTHSHLTCAYTACNRCGRTGHRANACTF